jgi:hypothetical protein
MLGPLLFQLKGLKGMRSPALRFGHSSTAWKGVVSMQGPPDHQKDDVLNVGLTLKLIIIF